MTHICVGKLTIIDSDNGLSPGRRQAIIWTNAGILLIGPLGTNFSELSIEIQTFSLKEKSFESVVCEMAAILCRPQCVNCNAEARIFRENQIDTMVTNALAPCVARSSAAMVLIMSDKWFLSSISLGFKSMA